MRSARPGRSALGISVNTAFSKSIRTELTESVGGIIAVYAFLAKDAPKYTQGYSICLAFCVLSALSCSIYLIICSMQNRSRERSVHDTSLTEYEKTELGDLSPEYRYLL